MNDSLAQLDDETHLFPEAGLTKQDVAAYYHRIADSMLRWGLDRPLTFKAYPDGIDADGFFNKHAPDHFPDSIRRIKVPLKSGEKSSTRMAAADSPADLIYFAGQNVIEIHAALATEGSLDTPDQLIFDLDPSDDDFGKVRRVARHCLSIFDQVALNGCLKLTGSRGLHLHVPLRPEAKFSEVKPLARTIAKCVVNTCPDLATLEMRKENRGDKVFIDYLRNERGQTVILPYSLRARPGAPIATPIGRKKLEDASLRPDRYTPDNLFRRLAKVEDPWHDFNRRRIGLKRLRKAVDSLP